MVNIETADRVTIYILPDSARCLYCNEKINNIDECPSEEFDLGMTCVPELCSYYTESEFEGEE